MFFVKYPELKSVERPLWRSITIGSLIFIVTLCIFLCISNFFNYKHTLYSRYEAYITDILKYVDRHIDDDDLAECVKSLKRSQKYDELEKFMDGIKEDFDIHYLYILTPVHHEGRKRIMSVISAENYYDRYIDTEGNLFLGWISDDEYDEETVSGLYEIMKQDDIVFFEEKTDWGTDYTGSLTLFDSNKNAYAILSIDADISMISKTLLKHTVFSFAIIILTGALFIIIFLLWIKNNFTNPICSLQKRVEDFASKTHENDEHNLNNFNFNPPEIKKHNELLRLSEAITRMTEDMRNFVTEIILAERNAEIMKQHATHMTELANTDSLTGIKNKTAYDRAIRTLEYNIDMGNVTEYGIAMIDLNFLKKINDTYGHERGNYAIKKVCEIICNVFLHSPVFRIGGDEFVVLLKDSDYTKMDNLEEEFKAQIKTFSDNEYLEPWQKISAAIGTARYNSSKDEGFQSVFKRADEKMYENKKRMKAERL